ncbi:hypothetical protein ASPVEDRAFT_87227 [Aspergillus versicolor CBS 583.65]|uniref:Methyltransferase domain-containing protein n=1 Tax=Aspergillus versicolor CBS 583.65 TaxID=1036611 RepID=A0A1L9PWJ0_ASPVE|nr:uncharacterized protein ASPVEDRAFT_87227 [Aspergillus versicolor CBS 583.65]OJJ05901.1 hypothetical protein ASPVEDRAFT_87227 [Aspergillus versicolor CBS 583.65]
MAGPPTTYLLRRDRVEAIRLGSQHLAWQQYLNHLLHPDIPIKDNTTIADIGAGTGIWAIEVANQLPSSQVTAFDVADTHFPSPEYWPSNAKFDLLDSLHDVSSELEGKFDVVHLRMWAFVVRNDDPNPLIQHAAKLLKPGGYVQWEDARFESIVVKGEPAVQFRQLMRQMSKAARLNFQWLEELDQRVKCAGAQLEVVDFQKQPWKSNHIPLVMDTFLVALENSGASLGNLKGVDPSVPSSEEWMEALEALHKDTCKPSGIMETGLYFATPFRLSLSVFIEDNNVQNNAAKLSLILAPSIRVAAGLE